jgi:Glycolipid transfer protein (GLTP)
MEDILRLEQQGNVHNYQQVAVSGGATTTTTLAALQEQSCAMGLLWIRRSLQFQYHMFDALLRNVEASQAAMTSYQHTLQPFHGWALQQIYVMGLKSSTPSNQEWLARLGGYNVHAFGAVEEKATRSDLHQLLLIWKPLIERWEQIYQELNLEDRRRV